jgi:hypothetical protein
MLYVSRGSPGGEVAKGGGGRRQRQDPRTEARGFERDETTLETKETGTDWKKRERDLNALQCLDVTVSYCTVADHDRQVLFSSAANRIWQWQQPI